MRSVAVVVLALVVVGSVSGQDMRDLHSRGGNALWPKGVPVPPRPATGREYLKELGEIHQIQIYVDKAKSETERAGRLVYLWDRKAQLNWTIYIYDERDAASVSLLKRDPENAKLKAEVEERFAYLNKWYGYKPPAEWLEANKADLMKYAPKVYQDWSERVKAKDAKQVQPKKK